MVEVPAGVTRRGSHAVTFFGRSIRYFDIVFMRQISRGRWPRGVAQVNRAAYRHDKHGTCRNPPMRATELSKPIEDWANRHGPALRVLGYALAFPATWGGAALAADHSDRKSTS